LLVCVLAGGDDQSVGGGGGGQYRDLELQRVAAGVDFRQPPLKVQRCRVAELSHGGCAPLADFVHLGDQKGEFQALASRRYAVGHRL
jgi:hypothetical protein